MSEILALVLVILSWPKATSASNVYDAVAAFAHDKAAYSLL